MAKLAAADQTTGLELVLAAPSRAGGKLGDDDALPCRVCFESYGEPVEGTVSLTRAGLARMVQRLEAFCDKRQGMIQLRDESQALELSLAAKRSRWTEKIKVTGLAGVPQSDIPVAEELRVTVGIVLRQDTGTASVEQRGGLVSTFDALAAFVADLAREAGLRP
ncbi:MAG: hypothetical protein HS108_07190 [Planctomycetes bacterium]|jgi:hypothetical protein|nr:hypothetical protein [Planctomycetota bacterium]MCL4729933.1 hypothetical protein [Planctomycetota bacterium]